MGILPDFKFFPRDVVAGSAAKVDDVFTAEFFGGQRAFRVTEYHGDWFMAELAEEED